MKSWHRIREHHVSQDFCLPEKNPVPLEAGDVLVLNLTVLDVEGNCFLQRKIVLYNLESQFTKIL